MQSLNRFDNRRTFLRITNLRSTQFFLVAFFSLGLVFQGSTANADLIPRSVLFGNPEKAAPQISPDGKRFAYLAPVDGVLNVWVAQRGRLGDAKPVTSDKTTGIRQFFWAHTNKHMLYLQDDNGDEDFHLYSVNLETNDVKDLTPFKKISAQVMGVSHNFPEEVLVGINDRDQHFFHDPYRINIVTGERKLVFENPGFVGFAADDNYNIKVALMFLPTSQAVVYRVDEKSDNGWSEFFTIDSEDIMTTSPAGFDKTGNLLFMQDSRGRNTSALRTIDLTTGKETTIFETDKADVSGALIHPTEKTVQAVSYTYDRTKWEILNEAVQVDLDYLKTVEDGELQITSQSNDDQTWTVAYVVDDGPVKYYLYDRKQQKAEFLFTNRPELEDVELSKMHSTVIKSRDGLDLVSYYTLPVGSDKETKGQPSSPLPMVLLVHGGPWARDNWGFNTMHQLLANRGYAVLSVNFRGSTGFGKSFTNAANKEWSGKMHDDLLDAVDWAVENKIAVRDKVAIMGGSYGGYATLVGLTFTPDTFACGVDIVGPSSIVSLLENPPPYWQPIMPMMKERVGNWKSKKGKEFLNSCSPLFKVDQIKKPLLIAQGGKDPRVKQSEADQIVAAMKEKSIPVTYMLYPEEGHGFKRPENKIAFFAATEAFLSKELGGQYEPIGDAFEGANFDVPEGASGVPGLSKGIKK
ncbi:MAG: alpha/beta fold hydrolase [Mariniblastus sp.]